MAQMASDLAVTLPEDRPGMLARAVQAVSGAGINLEGHAEMEGVDLSQLFHGREPPRRPFAYGGYANSHYLRNDRWTYFADNRMRSPSLFDRRRDRAELHNVAKRHPDIVRELHEKVVEEAGGRLPFYPK